MKKTVIVCLFLGIVHVVHAQLVVNDHQVPYDSETNTWLATIPETYFEHDHELEIGLEEGWSELSINGQTVTSRFNFTNIQADNHYAVSLRDVEGHLMTGNLQFTFLPIIQLKGEFGYDYQNGTVTIINPEDESDDLLNARIKWRGGTTNTPDKHKRNYKIKLDADKQLFGLRKDNNWILDAGQPDVFRLRNRIAMDIWNDMAHKPYYAEQEPKALNGVRGVIVEVFLNNEYRGFYNFSENIDRKQLRLKKMDESGEIRGVLYKGVSWDHVRMVEPIETYDNYSDILYGYEVKYPDLNDNDTTDWRPLVDFTNTILDYSDEEFTQNIEKWVDLPVFIDYSVFMTTVNALDNSGKNMFWAVYDKTNTQRMTLAPWDLDCTLGQRWGGRLASGKENQTLPSYYQDVDVWVFIVFYRTNTFGFNDKLNERYQELRQEGQILSTDSLINRFKKYYLAIKKSGAAKRETAKWSGDSDVWGEEIDFDKEYAYICDWITAHLQIVDEKKLPVYYDEDFFRRMGVEVVRSERKTDSNIYTLQGQQVVNKKTLKPGIYIVNGKKVVINKSVF